MSPLIERLHDAGLVPHGYCLAWEPGLLALHVTSDGLIALSYYSIPLTLIYFALKRQDGGHNWVLLLFAAFIVACGTTHLMAIYTLWKPAYWADGWIKAITAAVSLLTAAMLWPLVPKVLALPSPAMLQSANEQLRGEVAERSRAEQELQAYRSHLEHMVAERTADLERAKEELQHEVAERRELDRMKSEFISVVSHELRTPLTSLHGSLHLMARLEPHELAPESRELVEIATSNSARLMHLVNDILDFEQLESTRMRFTFRPVELAELLQSALRDMWAYGERYGVAFRLEEDVPPVLVSADPDRLMQVVNNLLSNAAKYSPTGESVSVSVARHNRYVRVMVTDRGPGIPQSFRNRVFQKFARADSSDTREHNGLGLGLSICKTIVERHGGQIGFDTQPGQGTTFFFDLPPMADEPPV